VIARVARTIAHARDFFARVLHVPAKFFDF